MVYQKNMKTITTELAEKAAQKILDDINGRSGMDTCEIDEYILQDMIDTWKNIILENTQEIELIIGINEK